MDWEMPNAVRVSNEFKRSQSFGGVTAWGGKDLERLLKFQSCTAEEKSLEKNVGMEKATLRESPDLLFL